MVIEITMPGAEPGNALNDMLGLRVVACGETAIGRFPFVALENAELTAIAVARSRRARELREQNGRAVG